MIQCQQKTTPSDLYYVAGVVELSPIENGIGSQSIIEGIREILEGPFEEEPDIIVFPEHILSEEMPTYVPEPKDEIIPCEQLDFDYMLTELSCLARMAQKYMVININEKVLCSKDDKCSRRTLIYSTNVVFDRRGAVISKHRKSHLHWKDVYVKDASSLDTRTFTTDFGVTFGHFIGFDLLFYSPAQELVASGITDFIHPTYWLQEFPFLTSLQLYQGWAHANDVNLLSAGGSLPSDQYTRSGIFAGKYGALMSNMSETSIRNIFVARVPRNKNNNSFKPLIMKTEFTSRPTNIAWNRDYNVDLFSTELLDSFQKYENHRVCHNNFCCSFTVIFKAKSSTPETLLGRYEYRIGVYEGPGTLQRMEKAELGICAIMACTNKELWSCGQIFNGSVPVGNDFQFLNITIKGNYTKRQKMLVMPSTVDSAFQPLPVDSYQYSRADNDEDDGYSKDMMYVYRYYILFKYSR